MPPTTPPTSPANTSLVESTAPADMPDAYAGTYELDFERPLATLEKQIADLQAQPATAGVSFATEIRQLRQKHARMLKKIYASLSGAQTVKVARHPGRPQGLDYVRAFVKDFTELHGDRAYADDRAILTGLGRIGPHKCMVVFTNKGKDVRERLTANFGMPHPEGYRKALKKMKLAEKFNLPVVTLIDTPGAFPGIGAEERGQSEAIAVNLLEMARLRVPILSAVIGEGGSGGALGIGVADRFAMMQYAWYSVISPEACAGIVWKQSTPENNIAAAEALQLTAAANLNHGTIDHILDEPVGGAHRNPTAAADTLEKWIIQSLRELKRFKVENLLTKRGKRLRGQGRYDEV